MKQLPLQINYFCPKLSLGCFISEALKLQHWLSRSDLSKLFHKTKLCTRFHQYGQSKDAYLGQGLNHCFVHWFQACYAALSRLLDILQPFLPG